MKLYCWATTNQQPVAEKYLIPSLNALNEFEIIYEKFEGEHRYVLWEKAKVILKAAEKFREAGEQYFAWSDNDAVVVKPIKERCLELLEANKSSVVFQSICGCLCTGFFLARLDDKFMAFWRAVVACDRAYLTPGLAGDQDAARQLCHKVKMRLLPEDEFWSPCSLGLRSPNDLPTPFPTLPATLRLAHMSCVNYPGKFKLMDHVFATFKPELIV